MRSFFRDKQKNRIFRENKKGSYKSKRQAKNNKNEGRKQLNKRKILEKIKPLFETKKQQKKINITKKNTKTLNIKNAY